MIYDFLFDCKGAINNEVADFQELLQNIRNTPICVGFMPAVWDDLYPVFALSCTSAKRIISPNVYIIPIGAPNCVDAKPFFEEIVNNFYQNDEFREQYDIELEEMLLLNNPKLSNSFSTSDATKYNVIFCRITLPNGTENALVIVPETPEDCWNKVFEPYEIKCDILIDSCKGMGNVLDPTRLYKVMRETNATELLPHYYFRGMYVKKEPPNGFNLLYTIPEEIPGQVFRNYEKEIYEIDWDENKSCS